MIDPRDVPAVMQAVRFQCYRENIYGALEILDGAQADHPDPRYAAEAARIRSWLTHLDSREAYVGAQEDQYRRLRWRAGLKQLEKRLRIWLGRKTRKMIERRGRDPEFRELEREITAVRPTRVLDAGCGEGAVAMAIAARHPGARVEGVEVAAANVAIARRLNRFSNVAFREGLAEEVHQHFRPPPSTSPTRSRCSSTCETWRGRSPRSSPCCGRAGASASWCRCTVPRRRPAARVHPDSRLRGSLSRLLE